MRNRMLALAATAFLALAGCSKKEEKEAEPVVPVKLAQARRGSIQRFITADGVVFPGNQSNVVPKISAPVRQFFVNRGDHVTANQLLAVLENADLRATAADNKGTYDQAQAQYRAMTGATVPEELTKAQQDVDAARQGMEAARKVYESRQALLREGAMARKLVDDANVAYVQAQSQFNVAQEHLKAVQNVSRHTDVAGAQGQLESAKGKYEAAEAQLNYSKIYSPIAGVIADRPLYPGEMAAAGSPLLTVMDVSRVIARANVPVGQAAFLKVGDAATVTQADANIDAQGKITVVSPAVDPSTTTVQVWVEVPNPGERLRPGVTVRVSALAQTIDDTIVIPQSALLSAQDGATMVLVVGADMVAHQRGVKVGVQQADKVQVVSGLQAGEQVITQGGVGVQDGAKVRLDTGKPEDKGGSKGEDKGDKDDKDK